VYGGGLQIKNNVCHTSCVITNHDAIAAIGNTGSALVSGNTIISDPGQGLSIQGSGDPEKIVENNTITINSARPNLEYDQIRFDCIRANDYHNVPRNKNIKIRNNTLNINGKFAAGFTSTYQLINGIMFLGEESGNEITGNTINALKDGSDPNVHVSAMLPGTYTANTILIQDNVITTDEMGILFGNYPGKCLAASFIGNSITKGPNPVANYCVLAGDVAGGDFIENVIFRNTTMSHGDLRTLGDDDDLMNGAGGSGNWTISGDCVVTVVDSVSGDPIVGAAVVITDTNTTEVFSGTTDSSGQVATQTLVVEDVDKTSFSAYGYTAYNNYTVSVSKSGYTTNNYVHTQLPSAMAVEIQLVAV
jgi:hypothetical protein